MTGVDGVVVVVFRQCNGKKEFLVLHRVLNWSGWELLKGHLEENESLEEAARREVAEEIGVEKILELKKLGLLSVFFDNKQNKKREMQGFLARIDEKEKVSFENNNAVEHDSFEWLGSKTAMAVLSFDNQKKVLAEAINLVGS